MDAITMQMLFFLSLLKLGLDQLKEETVFYRHVIAGD